jgi:putative addiction module component (TIGR02574 family)
MEVYMNATNDLLDLALQLPHRERASLARQLLLSLEPEAEEPDYETLWQAEINARLARVDRGEYSASDWREALTRIRQLRTLAAIQITG